MAPTSLLTISQSAARLSISRTTAWRLVRRGDIRSCRFGRLLRIDERDLEAFVARCRRAPLAYAPTARRPRALEAADSFAAKTLRMARASVETERAAYGFMETKR